MHINRREKPLTNKSTPSFYFGRILCNKNFGRTILSGGYVSLLLPLDRGTLGYFYLLFYTFNIDYIYYKTPIYLSYLEKNQVNLFQCLKYIEALLHKYYCKKKVLLQFHGERKKKSQEGCFLSPTHKTFTLINFGSQALKENVHRSARVWYSYPVEERKSGQAGLRLTHCPQRKPLPGPPCPLVAGPDLRALLTLVGSSPGCTWESPGNFKNATARSHGASDSLSLGCGLAIRTLKLPRLFWISCQGWEPLHFVILALPSRLTGSWPQSQVSCGWMHLCWKALQLGWMGDVWFWPNSCQMIDDLTASLRSSLKWIWTSFNLMSSICKHSE